MTLPARYRALALVSLLAGCKDGDAGRVLPLDCAWVQGGNCWKTTARGAIGCLPPATNANLSADGAICTYESGFRVMFTPPIVLPLPDPPSWNFTMVGETGETCLHFESAGSRMRLVVGSQAVEVTANGTNLSVTCPDGTAYTTANAADLLACMSGAGPLPAIIYSSSDTAVSLSLGGNVLDTGALPIFSCYKVP